MSRTDDFFGAGDEGARRMFADDHPMSPVPFPLAGRRKDVKDYDEAKVKEAVADPHYPVTDIDPRVLHATQPNVTRAGVSYYLGEDYDHTGQTYADKGNAGNRVPVVYNRNGTHLILAGTHRATAALLQGRQFRAKLVEGTWGEPRQPPRSS